MKQDILTIEEFIDQQSITINYNNFTKYVASSIEESLEDTKETEFSREELDKLLIAYLKSRD